MGAEPEFRLLGDIEVRVGGRRLDTGHARQQTVLAVLLVDVNRVVPVEQLVERVWGEQAPQRARGTLQSYLSRLRGTPGITVERRSGGYVLTADPATVDLHRFHELTSRARDTGTGTGPGPGVGPGTGDEAVVALLEQALALWRGDPFANLDTPWLNSLRDTLVNARRAAELDLTDRKLRLGRHAEVLTDLAARTVAHPLDERLAGQYVLALYRSGRRADALAHFQAVRRTLAEELGVDPTPELGALQQRILRADEDESAAEGLGADVPDVRVGTVRADTVYATTLTVGAPPGGPVRPAQLPTRVVDFTGRDTLVAELCGELSAGAHLVAVAGIGGVGKTTLALHVAHAVREHYPDGQLYVDLHGGTTTPADPGAVLGTFLRAFGTPEPSIPDGAEERSALYRSSLAGRKMLVLLDNARDAAQVRALLPGTEDCAALVTSRGRMVDLAGAHLVDLDVMDPQEALALFARIAGERRVTGERAAALDVVGACGFLPLAIRIAASRLAARKSWTVPLLVSKLADERRRLDELQVGDLAVTATFELGYGQLEAEQARAFRLLGLVDGPDISLAAAAALLDRGAVRAEEVLESLVDMSLLESAAPGRYRFHDLVRLFARSRGGPDEGALERLVDFYLATARNAYALERPAEGLVHHLEPSGCEGIHFTSQDAAIDWLFAEADCVLACARRTAHGATLRSAVDLLMVSRAISESGTNWQQYEQTAQEMKRAAQTAGDTHAEARARSLLTGLCITVGRFAEADEEAQQARLLGQAADDPVSLSYALNDLGLVANYRGRPQDASEYLSRALEAFRSYGNQLAETAALSNLSRAETHLGNTETAIALGKQALAIHEQLGVSMRRANTLYSLGIALIPALRLTEAEDCFREALQVFQQSRQPVWEGMTFFRLGEVQLAAECPEKAAESARQSLAILRRVGDPWRRATVLTLLGRAWAGMGERLKARQCWQEAMSLFEAQGAREAAEVRALLDLP